MFIAYSSPEILSTSNSWTKLFNSWILLIYYNLPKNKNESSSNNNDKLSHLINNYKMESKILIKLYDYYPIEEIG